jgi:hypothetical protein
MHLSREEYRMNEKYRYKWFLALAAGLLAVSYLVAGFAGDPTAAAAALIL